MGQQSEELLRSRLGPAWRSEDDCFVATSPAAAPVRQIEIQLRPDDDVDVCFFEGVSRSPFEGHFAISEASPEIAAEVIADFVGQILAEKLVLASWGWIGGGNRFVSLDEVNGLRHIKFVASWLGTYDRNLK